MPEGASLLTCSISASTVWYALTHVLLVIRVAIGELQALILSPYA